MKSAQELDRESIYYAQQLARDPQTPLPDTWLLRGYLRAPGAPGGEVPANLANLPPGYHQVAQPDDTEGTVLVSDTPRGRLFMLFINDRPNSVVMLFGLVPVVPVVLII